jgi:membrane protein implicated in regulation of membrane protease activity
MSGKVELRVKPSGKPSWSTRKPSRLGLIATFGLLAGLLIWRLVMPQSPPWLDLAALAWVVVLLVMVKRVVHELDRRRDEDEPRR